MTETSLSEDPTPYPTKACTFQLPVPLVEKLDAVARDRVVGRAVLVPHLLALGLEALPPWPPPVLDVPGTIAAGTATPRRTLLGVQRDRQRHGPCTCGHAFGDHALDQSTGRSVDGGACLSDLPHGSPCDCTSYLDSTVEEGGG